MAEPREAIFKVSAFRFHAGLLASPEALCTSPFVQRKMINNLFSGYDVGPSSPTEHLEQEWQPEKVQ